jgi:dTDP-3-amino-3,6-dideoxy-alpha-D-glucopyranose N,N-dimethyltransferase
MEEQMLYRELASYYDKIYHWKDYKVETQKIKELIKQYKTSTGNKLLDVGCGTGQHIQHLQDSFQCTGIDINKEILKLAKEKLPNTEFIQADMITMNLGKQYDVITCLFSSISYTKTYSNLEKTLHIFINHLCRGGLAIIEPFISKSVYDVGRPSITVYEDDDLKIARVNISEIDGDVSVMDMHYLIAERGEKVKHFVERHELGLFETDKTLEIMRKVGFDSHYLPGGLMKGLDLYIGIKK